MSDKALSSLTQATSGDTGDLLYGVVGGNSRSVKFRDARRFMALDTGDSPTFAGIVSPTLTGGTAANSTLTIKSTSGTGTSDTIKFQTGSASERVRIDANGVMTLMGREGSLSPTFSDTPLQVHVGSVTDANVAWFYWANDLSGAKNTFFKSRGTTPNVHTIAQSDDIVGGLEFFASDGTDWVESGRIQFKVDGTPGADDMPGRVEIRTTADGSAISRERLRIDSQGRATFWGRETEGGSTFDPTFSSIPMQVHVGSVQNVAAVLMQWGADANSSSLAFYKTRGTAVNDHTIVQADDRLGGISFNGADGSGTTRQAAFIQCRVDGTPGSSDMPGRLMFFTTPDGSATVAERLRIDKAGNVIVNTAAIATDAADGFLYVPTCAGTPTGTPTAYTGRAPIVVDTTNHKLYFYSGGAWRDAGP
jgi:hypothetical protein